MKQSVLTRYRVMAYVTAVMLLVLCTCMVFKYGFGKGEDVTFAVSQLHGLLYILYVVFAFDLGSKAKWGFGKIVGVLLAGTIPVLGVVVERKISRQVEPLVEPAPEPVRA
ncbi:DUF3817 domain-containing protein [Streptomyces sp. NPDC059506]|uniref:DUF3817 domain-containing protein n=1 Tax=Streptomyces sp. NPDC059506 TaxID=3347751 RepID=UPI0036A16975